MTKTLTLDSSAWRALRRAGKQALPRETGGILLGYYGEAGPQVTEIRVVPDPHSTRSRYRRDAVTAERFLDSIVRKDDTGVLGYIGEWHTHPLPTGPSATDVEASRQLAIAGGHDVVLLVLALRARGWTSHALNADEAGNVAMIKLHVKESRP